jgi:cytochrome c nitrite reductase small subunit
VAAALAAGCMIGVVVFGIGYSEMGSYLSTDPQVCANCHVMQDQYDAWQRGSHHNVATCDDCHLPHDSLVNKYRVQIEDGILHGYKFTAGTYPTTITIRQSSLDVANASCLDCHGELTRPLHDAKPAGQAVTCTHCHENVGHE